MAGSDRRPSGLDDEIATALQLQWSVRPDHRPDADSPARIPAAGYFHPTLPSTVMVCGSAAEYWWSAAADAATELSTLHASGAGVLLLADDGAHCPRFQQTATTAFDGDVARSPLSGSQLVSTLRHWALMQTAPILVHGVLLQVFGLGVLLTGDSGSGKSELALELLSRGHQLVADDAVELRRVGGGSLIGHCPPLLCGFIGTRSLGILDAGALYGDGAITDSSRVDLVLDLDDSDQAISSPDVWLHGTRGSRDILGVTLPAISLSRRLGHNLAVIAEAGCRDHWLRLSGYHADAQFIERQRRHIGPGASSPHPHGIR